MGLQRVADNKCPNASLYSSANIIGSQARQSVLGVPILPH